MGDIWGYLTGPHGGVMALCFGAGCVATYGFCTRTMLRESKLRIAELQGEIVTLRDQVGSLQVELRDEIRERTVPLPHVLDHRRPASP